MDTQQLRDAHYHMHYDIAFAKLETVAFQVISTMNTTPLAVGDFIDGGEDGWPNAEEHQAWLSTASEDEIAGWAIAGMR
mgnify:CR=1 FL=1